jgi:hypothetical protein
MNRRDKARVLLLLGVGFAVGFLRGYSKGFDEGMETGEIKELVKQGFSYEDAKYIVGNRERMVTTAQEIFGRRN